MIMLHQCPLSCSSDLCTCLNESVCTFKVIFCRAESYSSPLVDFMKKVFLNNHVESWQKQNAYVQCYILCNNLGVDLSV